MAKESKKKLQQAYLGKLHSLLSSSDHRYIYDALSSGHTKVLRMSRYESGAFDTSWIDKVEGILFDLGEIINAPKITTKEEGNIVPIELAKKITGESVQHLASHTQYIKEVDENLNIIPGKIMSFSGEDFLYTYENRFIATFIRRLVTFVEMRYEFIEKYIPLHKEETMVVKSKAVVDGATVEIESKIKVTSLTDDIEAEAARKAAERIKVVREYLLYYYASPFMQKMKTEKNVRSPIHLTNIIRKNPKYHKCYEVFMFLERYDLVGMAYHSEETFRDVSPKAMERLNWLLYGEFMSLEDDSEIAPLRIKNKAVKPRILTSIDDEEFLYGRIPDTKLQFVRIDEAYQEYLARRAQKELFKNPKAKVRKFYEEEYEDKRLAKEELNEILKLLTRKQRAAARFEKVILNIIANREREDALLAHMEQEERIETEERILTKKREEIVAEALNYGEDSGIFEETEAALAKEEPKEQEEPAMEPVLDEESMQEPEEAPIEEAPEEVEEAEEEMIEPLKEEREEEPEIEPEEASREEPVEEENEPSEKSKEEAIPKEEAPDEEETPAKEGKPVGEETLEEKPEEIEKPQEEKAEPEPEPEEEPGHEEILAQMEDESEITGRFVVKGPEGYFVGNGTFSKTKKQAMVFSDFNQAIKYKKLYGGKVVKL